MRKAAAGTLAALVAASVLAACGDAPEDEGNGDGDSAGEPIDFLPCMVSDAGGFDDKSFNQLGFEGLEAAAEELGSESKAVESNSENDYAPNVESLIAEGCDAIVTVGFALSAATVEAATANPDLDFILVDDAADNDFDGTKDAENIKPLLYDAAQGAFLAGYLAADYSKTGVVGTYGGEPFPTVTIFMDGMKQGVEYYNQQKGTDVKVVGWDGKNGSFTGGFVANETATNTARQLIEQNADVLLPVGGPIYQGALTAIEASGKDIALIGVDADFYESDPKTQDVVLTSILKDVKGAVQGSLTASGEGNFDPEAYLGTMENDGIGLAPFHNFEDKVSDTVAAELEEIKAGIIDGSIQVKSYLNP